MIALSLKFRYPCPVVNKIYFQITQLGSTLKSLPQKCINLRSIGLELEFWVLMQKNLLMARYLLPVSAHGGNIFVLGVHGDSLYKTFVFIEQSDSLF